MLLEALAGNQLAMQPTKVSTVSAETSASDGTYVPDNTLRDHPKYSQDGLLVGDENV